MNKIVFSFLLSVLFLSPTMAQEDVVEMIGNALKIGNARELVQFSGNTLDINLSGTANTYGKAQAEAVLKDFFQKNNARDFRYIHQGASPKQGLKYSIGKLTTDTGSYRVVMLLKQSGNNHLIDTITFSKE